MPVGLCFAIGSAQSAGCSILCISHRCTPNTDPLFPRGRNRVPSAVFGVRHSPQSSDGSVDDENEPGVVHTTGLAVAAAVCLVVGAFGMFIGFGARAIMRRRNGWQEQALNEDDEDFSDLQPVVAAPT